MSSFFLDSRGAIVQMNARHSSQGIQTREMAPIFSMTFKYLFCNPFFLNSIFGTTKTVPVVTGKFNTSQDQMFVNLGVLGNSC